MTSLSAPTAIAAIAFALLSACGADSVSDLGGDCVSHYDPVASAPTWKHLQSAMMDYEDWGPVASVRIQARREDVGAGDQEIVRVVDLLDRRGRRVVQVDVWRTSAGAWRAGVWYQCTD